MIRFSPSNVYGLDGNPTQRDACAGEYCYCEAPADCRLADIPAGSTEQLVDVGTNEVIVRTGAPTSGTGGGTTLFADVDNPWAFGAGCRLSISVGAFSVSITLNADGTTATDNFNPGGTAPILVYAALCIEEDGTVIGVASFDNGQSLAVEITGYNMASNRNWAGISGSAYSETTVDQIKTTEFPECPPCPIPPDLLPCSICGPNDSDKPEFLQLTFSGWGTSGPPSPCHPTDVCSQLNGSYTLPNVGFTDPCCYRLDFQIPTNTCVWTSDCPDLLIWDVLGYCVQACIRENTAIPPDMYELVVNVSVYGRRNDPPNTPFNCFDVHCNELLFWDYVWQDNVFFDPLVNPCNSIDHTIPNITFDGGTLYWIDDNLNPQRCTNFGGPFPVRIQAA